MAKEETAAALEKGVDIGEFAVGVRRDRNFASLYSSWLKSIRFDPLRAGRLYVFSKNIFLFLSFITFSVFPSGYGCAVVQGCIWGSEIGLPALPRCLLPRCPQTEERTESSHQQRKSESQSQCVLFKEPNMRRHDKQTKSIYVSIFPSALLPQPTVADESIFLFLIYRSLVHWGRRRCSTRMTSCFWRVSSWKHLESESKAKSSSLERRRTGISSPLFQFRVTFSQWELMDFNGFLSGPATLWWRWMLCCPLSLKRRPGLNMALQMTATGEVVVRAHNLDEHVFFSPDLILCRLRVMWL